MPNNKLKNFDRSDIMALIALLISLGAFSVSLIEANIMRDQQRLMQVQQKASVYPYLAKSVSFGHENGVAYSHSIINKGVGPAKIKEVSYWLNDELVHSIEDLRLALLDLLEGRVQSIAISNLKSYFISPEEEKSVVSIKLADKTNILQVLTSMNLEIDIEYCSIYNECWRTNEEGSDPFKSVQ